jgi:hypothetical protein
MILSKPLQPTNQQVLTEKNNKPISPSQKAPFELNKNKSEENENNSCSYDNKNKHQNQIHQPKQEQNKNKEEKKKKEIKTKQNQPPLSEKEMIRAKLFEGKCPSCNYYSKKMEKGEKRECEQCKKIWELDRETGFFYEEQNSFICDRVCGNGNMGEKIFCENCKKKCILKNNKILNIKQQIITPLNPKKVNFLNVSSFPDLQKDDKIKCSKCGNICECVPVTTLEMLPGNHYKYDYLCMRYLLKHFPNHDKENIIKTFSSFKHLLVPTVSHLKGFSPEKKKNNESSTCHDDDPKGNKYYLNDLYILDSEERITEYMAEFDRKKKMLLDSKEIEFYCFEKYRSKNEERDFLLNPMKYYFKEFFFQLGL